MRPRLRHLAAVSLMLCSLAGPLAAVAQHQACRMMGMHHDGRTPCWCGEMSGFGVTLATPPALPATPVAPPGTVPQQLARALHAMPLVPDSPEFPPTPPPPNELLD
jgi:hypothetical protein